MKYKVGDTLLDTTDSQEDLFEITDVTSDMYTGIYRFSSGRVGSTISHPADSVEDPDNFRLVETSQTESAEEKQPDRTEFATGMVRDTGSGKPRFDLITPKGLPYDQQMLYRQAMWMTRGAEHYGDRNWEKAATQEELDRFKESAFRHFMKWFFDVEDGDDNAAALHFNVDGAEYVKYRLKGAE